MSSDKVEENSLPMSPKHKANLFHIKAPNDIVSTPFLWDTVFPLLKNYIFRNSIALPVRLLAQHEQLH